MHVRSWLAIGSILLVISVAWAAGPDEEYVRIYKTIVEADSFREGGQSSSAISAYQNAQGGLMRLAGTYPSWNERLVNYRLNYIANQLRPLGIESPLPPSLANPSPPSAETLAAVASGPARLNPQIEQLRAENQILRGTAARLEAKLKEALSVQPNTTDPKEIARAQEQLRDLLKDNESLKTSLQEEQKRMKAVLVTNTVVTVVTNQVVVDPPELGDLRRNLTNQITALSALKTENDLLKKELSTAKTVPAPTQPQPNPELDRQVQDAVRDLKAMQLANQDLLRKQSGLEQALNEAKTIQLSQQEKLKRVEDLEKSLVQSQSDAQRLEEQKKSLEKKLSDSATPTPKPPEFDSSRRLVKLEKDLLESQSEVRLLSRQKGDLAEKLATARSTASTAAAAGSSDPGVKLQIIPGAGGEVASVEVHRQLKQAAWEVLNLQSQNQDLLKKQTALEQQLVKVSTSKNTFETIDQDRINRLEKLNQEVSDTKRKMLSMAQENQDLSRQLSAAREAQVAAGRPTVKDDSSGRLQEAQALLRKAEDSNRELQKRAGALEKELALAKSALKSPAVVSAPAPGAAPLQRNDRMEQELASAKEATRRLEVENRNLEKRLALAQQAGSIKRSVTPKSGVPPSKNMEREVASLRSRLEALEARAVPYTEAELSLFGRLEANLASAPSSDSNRSAVAAPAVEPPAEANTLVTDARKDFDAGRFTEAERKFQQAVKLDESNVYTLAHLAAAQFELQKFGDAEKTAQRALVVDPQDAACLYMLGLVRLRQDRVDDAVDAFSRSAQVNPQNSVTQNSLGVALSQKGLREPAETAFRKALQLRPDYGDAHYNLAVEYVLQQPPSFKLAQWHYQKALVNGHVKNSELETRLEAAAKNAANPGGQ